MKYTEKLSPSTKKTILSLSWRDIKSPTAGGAEVQTHEMLRGMDMSRYRIIHLAAQYENLADDEVIDGVNYIRKEPCSALSGMLFGIIKGIRKILIL